MLCLTFLNRKTSNKERDLNIFKKNGFYVPPTIDCIYYEIDGFPIPGTGPIEPDR